MKKILPLLAMIVLFTACQNTKEKKTDTDQTSATTQKETPQANATTKEDFDWAKIPESKAAIGAFPYITAPDGLIVSKNGYSEKAENGMTKFTDFSKLIMYNGHSFFDAEGKRAEMIFVMPKNDADFNQLLFDKNIDPYLESIGAVLIFKGQIPREKLDGLNKTDDLTVHKYMQGDVWNSDPVRYYALKHNGSRIVFQVTSNSAGAQVGVVELKDFKQTMKAPKASEMLDDIKTSGKAILNINFDTDKAILTSDGQTIVNEIFTLLSTNPNLKLSIEGHTDNTGSPARNKQLSEDRANTVMYALAGKGIDIKRLKAKGLGSEKPLVSNDTEDNKAKNRRVELVKF